jgi:hypothetical protein
LYSRCILLTRTTKWRYTITAMWTPEQTREAARRRLKREKERDAALKARRDEARRVARELVKRIVDEDESVRRIWGFGSTFDDLMPYHEHSDIDLAVEGGDIRA